MKTRIKPIVPNWLALICAVILVFAHVVILAGITAQTMMGDKYMSIETPAQKVCPYCGSKSFPPYHGYADWSRYEYHPALVYRCEDCDQIWGPKAEEWLEAHPDPEEWEILLPPEVRERGTGAL